MTIAQNQIEVVYNPSALLQIFTNSLQNETTRKVFTVKGIYTPGNGISYKGIYFDTLKDETTESCMTLVLPGLLRARVRATNVIECNAYLTKKVNLNGGRIDLQLNVIELLSKQAARYSEDEMKAFQVIQKKAETGYKDVDSFIQSKIINGETITVVILIGKAGIIDSDIKHQLQEAIGYYKFHFVRINLTSEKEIIESFHYYQKKCDILAIARGGGEHLEIFDRAEIAETALSLSVYFITALGHKENVPLLQKVADKPFITPTALGQYFNEIYNNTVAQLQNSKARLVDDITKQLEGNYKKHIENLQANVLNLEKSNKREVSMLQQQLHAAKEERTKRDTIVQELKKQAEKEGAIRTYMILAIIVALVVGWFIGQVFKG